MDDSRYSKLFKAVEWKVCAFVHVSELEGVMNKTSKDGWFIERIIENKSKSPSGDADTITLIWRK